MKILLTTWKYRTLFFLTLSFCVVLASNCKGVGDARLSLKQEPSIETAETAWIQMDLDSSRKNLEGIWADKGSRLEDRVKAAQMLAIQDWKFFKDHEAASDRIEQADGLGMKRSLTWRTMSRIARENSLFADARADAIKAIEIADNAPEKRESQILLAHAIVEQAMNARDLRENMDRASLDEANHLLTTVIAEEPGNPTASKLLFIISLLRRDGPAALNAWRNYFLIPENMSAPGLLAEPGRVLHNILPKWQGQVLSVANQERLVLAVAGSRFYNFAAILAAELEKQPGYRIGNHPAINEVVLYAGFIKTIKQITDEYYRQIAVNNSWWKRFRLEKNYQESFWREAERFWDQLPFDGNRPVFKQKLFEPEISSRFGTTVSKGSSGSYNGFVLFMGHRIVDDMTEVEQYGRKANFHFIVLESMVSNGYSGWFCDGRSIPGGWGTESSMIQVREAFLTSPFYDWRNITDPQMREGTEKLIAVGIARDDALARENPYAYLPGLQRRLQFDAAQQIYDSMKAKGYEGAELCIAFVAEYLRLKAESSVYGHEGRHAIDQIYYPKEFKKWTDEREFRAKLSQIVFTSNPKLAIAGSILDRSIGNNSQHGKAGERIMKTIVQWMKKHTAEISGIDLSRPMLPQFDLLSDDQIKALFIEADPMAADTAGF